MSWLLGREWMVLDEDWKHSDQLEGLSMRNEFSCKLEETLSQIRLNKQGLFFSGLIRSPEGGGRCRWVSWRDSSTLVTVVGHQPCDSPDMSDGQGLCHVATCAAGTASRSLQELGLPGC